jgi:hypothetical protein
VKNLRIFRKDPIINHHPDFEIVDPGRENVFIVGFGGRSGRVFTDKADYASMKEGGGVYILAPNEQIIENIKSLEKDLYALAEGYARMKHCYTHDVVRIYTKKYGRKGLFS